MTSGLAGCFGHWVVASTDIIEFRIYSGGSKTISDSAQTDNCRARPDKAAAAAARAPGGSGLTAMGGSCLRRSEAPASRRQAAPTPPPGVKPLDPVNGVPRALGPWWGSKGQRPFAFARPQRTGFSGPRPRKASTKAAAAAASKGWRRSAFRHAVRTTAAPRPGAGVTTTPLHCAP